MAAARTSKFSGYWSYRRTDQNVTFEHYWTFAMLPLGEITFSIFLGIVKKLWRNTVGEKNNVSIGTFWLTWCAFFLMDPQAVILLPLGPMSLMHKNFLRCKIIHGIHPIGCKDRSIWRCSSRIIQGFCLRPEAGSFVRSFAILCLVLWCKCLKGF